MKKIVALVLLALPVVVAPAAGMSGCASARTLGERADDELIRMRVGGRLAADPDVRRAKIDVDVIHGVVTLRGEATSRASADEATKLARETKGVKRVVNKLMIASEHEGESKGDLCIKSGVGTRLSADPDVRRLNVDVDVVNGVVYLSGFVEDQRAKDAAERIASGVDGVTRVENELQIIGAADEAVSEDDRHGDGDG